MKPNLGSWQVFFSEFSFDRFILNLKFLRVHKKDKKDSQWRE